MKSITKNQGTNEERTNEYINKWNTEKTLKTLINNKEPCVFDIGANNGCSINDFKNWWPKSVIHCFEPQHECYERSLSFSDIEKYLLKYDFSLFDISHISKNLMNGRTDWVDVIYVNNKFK